MLNLEKIKGLPRIEAAERWTHGVSIKLTFPNGETLPEFVPDTASAALLPLPLSIGGGVLVDDLRGQHACYVPEHLFSQVSNALRLNP